MIRLLFLFVLALMSLYARAQSPVSVKINTAKPQSVHLEELNNGTRFIIFKDKISKLNFCFISQKGQESTEKAKCSFGDEIVGSQSNDSSINIYTLSEQRNLLLKNINIFSSGKATQKPLLELDTKLEKLSAVVKMDSVHALITVSNDDQLIFRSFAGDKVLNTYLFKAKNKVLTDRLKKGVVVFNQEGQVPLLYYAKEKLKAFYENGHLILVLDATIKGSPATLVEDFNLESQTSSSFTYKEHHQNFYRSVSYYHNGYIYRLFDHRRDLMLNVHELGKEELTGTYNLYKKSTFSGAQPRFTTKQYHKSLINIKPITDFRVQSRNFMFGEKSLCVMPLDDGGIQVNIGNYYEDNTGIIGVPGAVGLLITVASMTARSLHESGKGVERYVSLNFNNSQLSGLSGKEHTSALNQLDDVYLNLMNRHQKLLFFDYCVLNREKYVAFVTAREKDKLQIFPLSNLEAKEYQQ
ncbi:hypothetical protein D770_14835 [Flammeovirgaceae bacterium 311]|nr:hypothetical protein D770_14835 [Flammeovirgaceae bacterium 311]